MSESMNDERLTADTENKSGGRRLADLAQRENTDALAGKGDVSTEYGATPVGTGSAKTGTTNTSVDAGSATMGVGTTETSPGGCTTLGSGDSMDDTNDPVGMDTGALPDLGGDDSADEITGSTRGNTVGPASSPTDKP